MAKQFGQASDGQNSHSLCVGTHTVLVAFGVLETLSGCGTGLTQGWPLWKGQDLLVCNELIQSCLDLNPNDELVRKKRNLSTEMQIYNERE